MEINIDLFVSNFKFAWLNLTLLILVAIGLILVVLFHVIGSSVPVYIIDDSDMRGLIDASSWDVSNILIIHIAIICITAFFCFRK